MGILLGVSSSILEYTRRYKDRIHKVAFSDSAGGYLHV